MIWYQSASKPNFPLWLKLVAAAFPLLKLVIDPVKEGFVSQQQVTSRWWNKLAGGNRKWEHLQIVVLLWGKSDGKDGCRHEPVRAAKGDGRYWERWRRAGGAGAKRSSIYGYIKMWRAIKCWPVAPRWAVKRREVGVISWSWMSLLEEEVLLGRRVLHGMFLMRAPLVQWPLLLCWLLLLSLWMDYYCLGHLRRWCWTDSACNRSHSILPPPPSLTVDNWLFSRHPV